jgi:hypothetical protein
VVNRKSSNYTGRCHGTFILDTGCLGPILSVSLVKKEKILVDRQNSPIQVVAALDNLMLGVGKYFSGPLEMVMGKHDESLHWEVGLLQKVISGYLPVSSIRMHNPDINWYTNCIQFRGEPHKNHCIPTEIKVKYIEDWQMLAEDQGRVFQIGIIVWCDEHCGDEALRLFPVYQEWVDVFSTEKIDQLPVHINYNGIAIVLLAV